jgi:hypothetical protein
MNKSTVTVVRWIARVLSVPILLYCGFFLVANLIGMNEPPSLPRNMSDFIGLTALVMSLAGLAAAWKWEIAGAVAALVAVLVGTVINPLGLLTLLALIPVDALLFLAAGWVSTAGAKAV